MPFQHDEYNRVRSDVWRSNTPPWMSWQARNNAVDPVEQLLLTYEKLEGAVSGTNPHCRRGCLSCPSGRPRADRRWSHLEDQKRTQGHVTNHRHSPLLPVGLGRMQPQRQQEPWCRPRGPSRDSQSRPGCRVTVRHGGEGNIPSRLLKLRHTIAHNEHTTERSGCHDFI